YHYIKNGDDISNLIPEDLTPIDAKMSVIACDHLNPQEGREIDGLNIRTPWGEIAYRLGGKEGYETFKKDDQNRSAPGVDKLQDFLKEQQPFVIMFDEILEYIAGALSVVYAEEKTNLGSQTFTFLTQLTKAMGSLENGLLVVTLPSSELEDFTPKKERGLAKLSKIFGRVETIETPVKGDEVYSIIRKRLFQNIKDEEEKNEIIHDYFEMYRENKEDLPPKADEKEYKERMEKAYPFHPETIDVLYEKWGTFSSFQRTRGVLRLLALVIGDVYKSEKNIDLILPSDINLGNSVVKEEFIKHIGTEYNPIIASDISGPNAKAENMDKENREWNHLAESISTSIFMNSFTAQEKEVGMELSHIKLTILRPDIMPSMVTEVKEKLHDNLWYLNEKDGTYFFSEVPNLRKMVRDKKELFEEEKVIEKLESILKNEVGDKFRTYIWPKKSKDIPDNQELKLVVLHPDEDEDVIEEWTKNRGSSFRTYKNTLIFAVPNIENYGNFREDIKEYLALEEIKHDVDRGDRESLEGKKSEIKENIKKIENDFSYNVRKMYNKIRVKDDEIDLGMPVTGKESLSNWYRRELENKEEIISNLHYRPVVKKFMGDKEKIATKKVLNQYYKNREYSMLESEDVLKSAIVHGVREGNLALSRIEDEELIESGFHYDEHIDKQQVTFDEEEYILKETHVEELVCSECGELLKDGKCPKCEKEGEKDEGEEEEKEKEPEEDEEGERTPMETKYKKLEMKVKDVPVSKIVDINTGVFKPLTEAYGGFSIDMELRVEDEEGISEKELDEKVRETLKQIGAEIVKEEKEE
ncbi:MAG: DUF499 domain-containing protein, partial [Thermoplasmatota archaeon]